MNCKIIYKNPFMIYFDADINVRRRQRLEIIIKTVFYFEINFTGFFVRNFINVECILKIL